MFHTSPKPWLQKLIGKTRPQQVSITMTLMALAVYVVCIGAQWFWVGLGFASAPQAAVLTGVIVLGQVAVYAALRSGWSERFSDPALTLPQMGFALLCLGAAYAINPHVRGVLLMVVALVLVFGAFTLNPSRCRWLGWLATTIVGTVMLLGVLGNPVVFDPMVELVSFVFMAATLPLIGHLAGRLSRMRHDLRTQKRALREALARVNLLANRDELTGLPNRRGVLDWAARELPRLRRTASTLCIVVLDLDHFKAVNDRFGHAVGDQALVNFAQQAQTVLREVDLLARWGGEEFLLMLPDATPDIARGVVHRLYEHLRQPVNWLNCPDGRVSFSAGLAAHHLGEPLEQTLARADQALYQAKRQGRGRCVEANTPLD